MQVISLSSQFVIDIYFFLLLRLNQILYYALCLSYHSNTKAVLFACLSSGRASTTGRLLGLIFCYYSKIKNIGKFFH